MSETVTPQTLQMQRLKQVNFNKLDGEDVANGMVNHRHLWDAFVVGRFKYNALIELRDLKDGHLNVDTIMVLTTVDRAEALCDVAQREWKADEVGYSAYVDGKFKSKWTAPHRDEKEMWQDLGGLKEGWAVVRLWWD